MGLLCTMWANIWDLIFFQISNRLRRRSGLGPCPFSGGQSISTLPFLKPCNRWPLICTNVEWWPYWSSGGNQGSQIRTFSICIILIMRFWLNSIFSNQHCSSLIILSFWDTDISPNVVSPKRAAGANSPFGTSSQGIKNPIVIQYRYCAFLNSTLSQTNCPFLVKGT